MKMEIDEKIEEVKELQKEIVKMKKDHDAKYIEIVEEAKKMSDSLIQIQKERDLYYAKVQVLEKREKDAKIEKNMMMFEHGGNIVLNFDDEEKKEVDECILDVKCDGDCDEVVHQAEQLRNMQLQGGRRDSPQEKSVIKRC